MIPFCKPCIGEEEKKAVMDVLDSRWVVMGKKTEEFEEKFAEYVGSKYAVFVDSGTSALFLAMQWVKRNQKLNFVDVPSLTFTSTAEIVVNSNLVPRFVDVDMDTMCIGSAEKKSVRIPVHLTGNLSTAEGEIYDSAHRIQKNDVKDSNSIWCYSFYATKNLTTGQGGMIALNDTIAYLWLKAARDHGISKGTTERYVKGQWQYSIDFVGFREKSDDIHAAMGIEQLKKLEWMDEQRQNILDVYNNAFGLKRTGNHLYPLLVNDRDDFINFMKDKGVQCSVHFLPLHKQPAYQYYPRDVLNNTDYLGDRLVSLPLYPELTIKEAEYVAQCAIESQKICEIGQ